MKEPLKGQPVCPPLGTLSSQVPRELPRLLLAATEGPLLSSPGACPGAPAARVRPGIPSGLLPQGQLSFRPVFAATKYRLLENHPFLADVTHSSDGHCQQEELPQNRAVGDTRLVPLWLPPGPRPPACVSSKTGLTPAVSRTNEFQPLFSLGICPINHICKSPHYRIKGLVPPLISC